MVAHIKIENSVFGTFGPLVSCVFWIIKQIHKPFRTSSNEHSSQQVWIQLAQWFQGRRLKCKSLQMTMTHAILQNDGNASCDPLDQMS